MIRISVFYPNGPEATFDHEYYRTSHCPMVAAKLQSYGLQRVEIDKGLGGGAPAEQAPFVAIGHIIIDSVDSFQKGMAVHGQEIMRDVPNYTNITPQIQVSEVVQ